MGWKIPVIAIIVISIIVYLIFETIGFLLDRPISGYFKENAKDHRPVTVEELQNHFHSKIEGKSILIWFLRKVVFSKWFIKKRLKEQTFILEKTVNHDHAYNLKRRDTVVDERFSWDDDRKYFWEFRDEETTLWRAIYLTSSMYLYMVGLSFGILYASDFLNEWFGLIVNIFFLGFFLIYLYYHRYSTREYGENSLAKLVKSNKSISTLAVSVFITMTIFFLLTSPKLNTQNLFKNMGDDRFIWLLYSTENLFNDLFHDIFETLGWKLTNIEPKGLSGQLILAAINILIIYTIIEFILTVYKFTSEKVITYVGTVKETCLYIQENNLISYYLIQRGELSSSKNEKIPAVRFVYAFSEDFHDEANAEMYGS